MTPTTEASVREDDTSIFYTFRRGSHAVTLTVLKVGGEFICCDVTTHAPAPAGEMCGTLALPAVCLSSSLAFAKGFYSALQVQGKTQRLDDDVVFGLLAAHLVDELDGPFSRRREP